MCKFLPKLFKSFCLHKWCFYRVFKKCSFRPWKKNNYIVKVQM